MKNKYGKSENLKEYYDNGNIAYEFWSSKSGFFRYEVTIDETGVELTYRNSNGISRGFDKPKQETNEAPKHYDNSNGSLYKVALERGWNPYLFDIVKRLERSEKKGEFETDLNKSKLVIDLWLKERDLK